MARIGRARGARCGTKTEFFGAMEAEAGTLESLFLAGELKRTGQKPPKI